tara:strand:- start:471 stop:704 length:234 start_codon:yes stop_codon:yes gene_type:complete
MPHKEDVQGFSTSRDDYIAKERIEDETQEDWCLEDELSEENHADGVNDVLKLQPTPEHDPKYEAYLKEEMQRVEGNL